VRDLRTADPPMPPFAESCWVLRLEFHDLYQRLFVKSENDDGWTLDTEVVESLELDKNDRAKTAAIGMDAGLRESDQYYDELETWLDMPYLLASREPDPLERLRAGSDNPLNALHAEVSLDVRARAERAIADRRATHLIAEVFVHLSKRGEFPENLAELDGPDLAELLRDPFSGRDFVYEKVNQDFRFYGVERNGGDLAYWPM